MSRLVAGVLLAGYLGSSMVATLRFWSLGRGDYRDALTAMCVDAGQRPIRVASDHDFRNGLLIRYYAQHGSPGCEVTYVSRDEILDSGAGWFVAHDVGAPRLPSAEVVDAAGHRYTLVRTYPSHELSGMTWHVYRIRS